MACSDGQVKPTKFQTETLPADRGVKVRIYLDGTQLAERDPSKPLHALAETPGVEIRTKHKLTAPIHLKCYEIDGHLLRTGAANFSASGLNRHFYRNRKHRGGGGVQARL